MPPAITSGCTSIPNGPAPDRSGRRFAHGYLTLSLTPMLLLDVFEVTGASQMVNYGIGKVRFPRTAAGRVASAGGGRPRRLGERNAWAQTTLGLTFEVEGTPSRATDPAHIRARNRDPILALDGASEPVLHVLLQRVIAGKLRDLQAPGPSVGVPLRRRDR